MTKIIEFFNEALKKSHLSHSYLISGTENIELAKIIAKNILCRQEHTGCGSCSSCLKLASDNHPDLMIVIPDGASIKNAQVEAFQEFIYIRPFESMHKIVIFNEVHLMTERAQNRILKVLEEPPEYAVFILMTEHAESLLETVLSRCQIVNAEASYTKAVDPIFLSKAFELVQGIEKLDAGRVLEYGAYMKQEKANITTFLAQVTAILRDILIFRETHNYQLISPENFSILNYKEQLGKLAMNISRKKNIELIFLIEEIDQKIKSNMNFDLTVDKLLFKCIEREA